MAIKLIHEAEFRFHGMTFIAEYTKGVDSDPQLDRILAFGETVLAHPDEQVVQRAKEAIAQQESRHEPD